MSAATLEGRPKTPVHLWIVGILSLLWSLMGVFDYLATEMQLESYMSQFSEEQLDYFYAFPTWMVAAWAFGVWGGLAGSVGLLLRRRWAVWAFALSLAGMAISTTYTFGLSNGAEIMGTGPVIFTVVIWIAAVAVLLYARAMARRGVLS